MCMYIRICMCVCLCVCVCARARMRVDGNMCTYVSPSFVFRWTYLSISTDASDRTYRRATAQRRCPIKPLSETAHT